MHSLIPALKSEAIKLFSLRSTWVYAFFLTFTMYGSVALYYVVSNDSAPASWVSLTQGGAFFSAIAIIFMGSTVAGELDTRMFAHAFMTQDNRTAWLAARFLVNSLFLISTFIIGLVLSFIAILVFNKGSFGGDGIAELYKLLGTIGLFALFAATIAVATRSKVAAISIPLLWYLAFDTSIVMGAKVASPLEKLWLISPTFRWEQIALGNPTEAAIGWGLENYQPIAFNITVLAIWVTVALAGAYLVNARRDVR